MRIQDFCDMVKFEEIMSNWAKSTGLATVAVGADGKYISECYNFTEFCIDLTRGSTEGRKRCEQCDRDGNGVYPCHAGLVDFGIPITLDDGTVLGSIIGGQVLPENPDEERFRATARELGINEDKYIKALQKVNVRTKEEIDASANLLGDVINMFVRASYTARQNSTILNELTTGISAAASQLATANDKVKLIDGFSKRQNILALNASIEAARAGGLIIEVIYHMAVVEPGVYQDRAGLLYGPFSPIYGIGAVLMTIALNRFHKANFLVIFLVSAVIGGAFEYLVSWFFQFAFGIMAWDYTGTFLSIDGRTNGMFMAMWGVLGCVWIKLLLPRMLKVVNAIPWTTKMRRL